MAKKWSIGVPQAASAVKHHSERAELKKPQFEPRGQNLAGQLEAAIEDAVVTRVVGDGMAYVSVSNKTYAPLVITPDAIRGYNGESLKKFGITQGAQLKISFNPVDHSVLDVKLAR